MTRRSRRSNTIIAARPSWRRQGPQRDTGEEHGLSVFFRLGDDVFHTYSAYARGTEALTDARALLDMTPYGRQQAFRAMTAVPATPTYGVGLFCGRA